jgi:hypothetical protein
MILMGLGQKANQDQWVLCREAIKGLFIHIKKHKKEQCFGMCQMELGQGRRYVCDNP